MSAAVLESGPGARSWPVPVVLGLSEGVRIVRHPIAVVGGALMVVLVLVVGDNGTRDAFEVLSTGPTFFYGVSVYFAANLVASRDRRARSGELLAATSSPVTDRVAGLCVAAAVPAVVTTAFVLLVHVMNLARDLYFVVPGVWHMAQAPMTVLGGALLGIMVARLTSVPGAALLGMVAMFAWNIWVSNHTSDIQTLGTYMSWALWAPHADWAGMETGSPGWHVAYLAALCAMAATGAFLRESRRTWRVLVVGAGCTAAAVAAGVLQLP